MTFKTGVSGNPSGRPKGAVSKRTQLANLLLPHAEELIAKAVALAKGGDVNALRICLDKLLAKPKDAPIEFNLPAGSFKNTSTLLDAGEHVIRAVAAGEISPEEGKALTTIFESQRKTIEVTELDARIREIEHTLKLKTRS